MIAVLMPVSAAIAEAETAVDQHGNRHSWAPQAGMVTIIDFAAWWCAPCRTSLPRLEAFANGHPELRVLVISVDERVAGRDALVDSLGLTVPVLWDEGHQAAAFYRPEGMPATFVYDATGHQVLALVGSDGDEWAALERTVESAVGRRRLIARKGPRDGLELPE